MMVFVTGGAGYIGSIAVEQLIHEGHEVVVFDSLERGHAKAVHPDAGFVRGNLLDKGTLGQALDEAAPDAIMHFAAYAYVGESMEHPMAYFENNVVGSLNLISAATEREIDKFIFSSTCSTYGIPTSLPITEQTPQVPVNPYGESKFIVERMLDWANRIHGMDVVVLRYFNAAGASSSFGEDHAPETHIIPLLLKGVDQDSEPFKIFGRQYDTPDGTCVRDYIHVKDLAEAHVMALKPGLRGTFNLGSGRGFSVLEVLKAAEEVTGCPIASESRGERPGDPPILVAGNKKASDVLGWKPRYVELEQIIGDAWEWHQRNPAGYE